MMLVLGSNKINRFLHLLDRILKVYIEVLTGFNRMPSSDSLNTTFLFQSCILGVASGNGGSKQHTHSKGRGGGGEPSIAWVQLVGQLAVTSSDDRLQHGFE